MGRTNFDRQFIMLDFTDLDNPEFLRLARAPEFSTYLTMRRHIWRSQERHSRHLDEWYKRGYLCCGLSRDKISQSIGGDINLRTVSNDIARLLRARVIEVQGSGREQVFVMGRWEIREGVYVEYYYLDRITSRAQSGNLATTCKDVEPEAEPGKELPGTLAKSCQVPLQNLATVNRESSNRELGIGDASPPETDWDHIWKKAVYDLKLQLAKATFETWVKSLTARRVDGHLEVVCNNERTQEWLQARLAPMMRKVISEAAGEAVEIRYIVRGSIVDGAVVNR